MNNVRLIPHALTGKIEKINKELFWFNGEIKESLEIENANSILLDQLSSTALISYGIGGVNIRMLHFLACEDFILNFLNIFTELEESEDFIIDSGSGPYITITRKEMKNRNDSNESGLDEATLNVLNIFSKLPLIARGVFNRFQGKPQDLFRPRVINKSTGIPVNPWIFDRLLNLEASRIKFEPLSPVEKFSELPKKIQATMVYNSGGKIISNSDLRREMFWILMLADTESNSERAINYGIESKESYDNLNSKMTINEEYNRIDKDLHRLGESDIKILNKLERILKSYCVYDQKIGYVQGMADLALPFAKIIKSEELALECFKSFFAHLRSNFLPTDTDYGINNQLNRLRELISILNPILNDYLKFNRDSDSLFFTYRWLLVLFRREIDVAEGNRLWDVMLAAEEIGISRIEDYRIYFALAMLLSKRDIYMKNCSRFEDLLKVCDLVLYFKFCLFINISIFSSLMI